MIFIQLKSFYNFAFTLVKTSNKTVKQIFQMFFTIMKIFMILQHNIRRLSITFVYKIVFMCFIYLNSCKVQWHVNSHFIFNCSK